MIYCSSYCLDLETLREMKESSGESNVILAIVVVLLLLLLAFLSFRLTRRGFSPLAIHTFNEGKRTSPRPLVYSTPSQQQDSVIYYASTGASMTHVEVPPELLQLHQLSNGNIHITLPSLKPIVRPALSLSMTQPIEVAENNSRNVPETSTSPTPSQLLYSFDDDPVYDSPSEDNVYEELSQAHDVK